MRLGVQVRPLCPAPGCVRVGRFNGYCSMHRTRLAKHGQLEPPNLLIVYRPDEPCIDCGRQRAGMAEIWRHRRCPACYYVWFRAKSAAYNETGERRISFLPKDRTAREVCIETLNERGKPWHEEDETRGRVIVWHESEPEPDLDPQRRVYGRRR